MATEIDADADTSDLKYINYVSDVNKVKEIPDDGHEYFYKLFAPGDSANIYRAIRNNPKPPKCEECGYRYEIAKGTLFTGFLDFDGFTYQEYELIKVKETPPEGED